MVALLLVDIQKGMDDTEYHGGSRNNMQAEANCRLILDYFRYHQLPLFHIQHCSENIESPLYPGKEGNEIKEMVAPIPGEPIIKKSTNSAFVRTGLEGMLRNAGVNGLIVVGLTTDHCVSATVRNGADLGFKTTIISDATATYARTATDGSVFDADLMHATAIASLQGEFASVITTSELLDDMKLHGSTYND